MSLTVQRIESKTVENIQIRRQIDNKNETILFITDIHIKFKNLDDITVLENKIKSMDGLLFIVIGGDVLDTHERLHTQLLNRAYKFIETCSDKALTFVLVGNHDYINNQQFLSDAHWMNALKKWDSVIVVDTLVSILNEFTGLRCLCVPFVPPGRFLDALQLFPGWEQSNIIFAHQEIKGCKMGVIKSTEGDEWKESYPFLISGHIHDRQFLGKNVFYPGSTINHACNDVGGMLMLLFSQQALSLPSQAVRSNGGSGAEIFFQYKNISFIYIDLGFVPKKIIYTNIDNISTVMQNSKKTFGDVANKTIVCVSGSKEDIVAFRKSYEYTTLSNLTRVKFNCQETSQKSISTKAHVAMSSSVQRDALFWTHANEMVEKAADPELKKDFHSVKTQCLHI